MRGGILASMIACWTASASAQTVELCEVEWLDAARVRALIIVEQPDAVALRVSECDAVGARLEVEFDSGGVRERRLEFADTDTDARSRLVGLVLVELARLGDSSRTVPLVAEEVVVDGSGGAAITEAVAEAGPPLAAPPPADASPRDARPLADPLPPPVVAPSEPTLQPPSTERGPAHGFDLSRRTREWRVGLGGGLVMHRLERVPTALPQLRLRAQWTRVVLGARASGRRSIRADELNGLLSLAAFSAFIGVEMAAWQLAPSWRLSTSAQLEAGLIRSESRIECGDFSTCFVRGPQLPLTTRPLLGGFLSARLEFVGKVFGALELEAGYARGAVMTDSVQDTRGIGGLWIALALELAVGGSSNAN